VTTEAAGDEEAYYPIVKNWLEEWLKQYFKDHYHLEITAHGKFSSMLKMQIPQHRDIIFAFLKGAFPDITGFVIKNHAPEFIVVEFKNGMIKLDDIYQTRKYAELLDAHYALLVSTEEIPAEIIKLSTVVSPYLLALPAYGRLAFVHLSRDAKSSTWLPDFPFLKDA
jgi:hypothetical protein